MSYYLIIHTRYKDIQLGVYHDCDLIESAVIDSKSSSKLLIHTISDLLRAAAISLNALSFIGCHQGPAPFTTIRVALATVNGLASAQKIPLVGVNGLLAALDEQSHTYDYMLVMLNAFCNDVYYALYEKKRDTILEIGYAPARDLIIKFSEKYAGIFYIIGNGAQLHKNLLEEYFAHRGIINLDVEMASIERIAQLAFKQFNCGDLQTQLLPIYLKNQFGTSFL